MITTNMYCVVIHVSHLFSVHINIVRLSTLLLLMIFYILYALKIINFSLYNHNVLDNIEKFKLKLTLNERYNFMITI